MSLQLTFPKSHYCGIVMNRPNHGGADRTDNLPLGFITPWGEDAGAKKRMATVDQWVGSNSRGMDKKPEAVVLENTPMGGFCLLDAVVRSSRYNSSVKFRIEDPRGFELEISASNLMAIMEHSVIDKGEILDMCVWGRDKSENVLVPVSSPHYRVMQHNSERISKSASLKDLRAGDTVVMQNGYEGRYIGKYYELTYNYTDKIDGSMYRYHASKKPKWVFERDGVVRDWASSPKLSEIYGGEPLTPPEGLAIINKTAKYSIDRTIVQKQSVETATTYAPNAYMEPTRQYVVEYRGELYLIANNYNNSYNLYKISREYWEQGLIHYITTRSSGYFARDQIVTESIPSIAGLPMWVRTHTIELSDGSVVAI